MVAMADIEHMATVDADYRSADHNIDVVELV